MNRRAILAAFVAAAASLAGVASPARAGFGPSEVIFPPQKIPLRFSHREHLGFRVPRGGEKIRLECDYCHDKAEKSLAAADDLLPAEAICADSCHPVDRANATKPVPPGKAPARCDACHLGPDPTKPAPVELPAPNLKFNHAIHADRGIRCQRCHGTMAEVDEATRESLPRMSTCLECHDVAVLRRGGGGGDKHAPARCSTCHPMQIDGTLRQEFPCGVLAPSGTFFGDRHTADYAARHAQDARGNERYCQSCHRRDFCTSCHDGVVKPMSLHGNDYLSIHPIDARKNSLECGGCHRRQTFCLGCHERSGVVDPLTADAPNRLGRAMPPRRFHPPFEKWVAPPRTPDHHAFQAERNVRQCVACHREETCIECHSSAGASVKGLPDTRPFHVSPHPPAFGMSRECASLAARNGRVCLKCHAPTDPNLACH